MSLGWEIILVVWAHLGDLKTHTVTSRCAPDISGFILTFPLATPIMKLSFWANAMCKCKWKHLFKTVSATGTSKSRKSYFIHKRKKHAVGNKAEQRQQRGYFEFSLALEIIGVKVLGHLKTATLVFTVTGLSRCDVTIVNRWWFPFREGHMDTRIHNSIKLAFKVNLRKIGKIYARNQG